MSYYNDPNTFPPPDLWTTSPRTIKTLTTADLANFVDVLKTPHLHTLYSTPRVKSPKRYIIKVSDTFTGSQSWKVVEAHDLLLSVNPHQVLEVYEFGKQCSLKVSIENE